MEVWCPELGLRSPERPRPELLRREQPCRGPACPAQVLQNLGWGSPRPGLRVLLVGERTIRGMGPRCLAPELPCRVRQVLWVPRYPGQPGGRSRVRAGRNRVQVLRRREPGSQNPARLDL